MVLDRSELEAVLKRAIDIDLATGDESFDLATVEDLADELGVSRTALIQAIDEVVLLDASHVTTSAQVVVTAPPDEVLAAVESLFRLRGLRKTGVASWEQDSGWWPDLYRFRASTPVSVWTGGGGESTWVRLSARLDNAWRSHVLASLAAPLLLVLWTLTSGSFGEALAWLPIVAAWMLAVTWAYRLRRAAIGRRLVAALRDVARPSYRLAPW
jgi:hypothetical protein